MRRACPGASDQPLPGARWLGHPGDAGGLPAGLWIDREGSRVIACALPGSAADPMAAPRLVSAFFAAEDFIMAELAP